MEEIILMILLGAMAAAVLMLLFILGLFIGDVSGWVEVNWPAMRTHIHHKEVC